MVQKSQTQDLIRELFVSSAHPRPDDTAGTETIRMLTAWYRPVMITPSVYFAET